MAELIPLPQRRDRPVRQPEPLWREALGVQLRRIRQERGERLADTAECAGVSPQYLSEIERGLKEPSSEMIAAVAGALDVSLVDLTVAVGDELRSRSVDRAVGSAAVGSAAVGSAVVGAAAAGSAVVGLHNALVLVA